MRTNFFLIGIAILIAKPLSAQISDKPNIVWIVSEDNSPMIGAYGDTFATTPNIDSLAKQGVLYTSAFSTAPVCAPSRSTLITGMYPPSIGTEHMRSNYPVPDFVHFYPYYLKKAGYYTTNNSKKDYNTIDQKEVWNESSPTASYKNRKEGQPFFAVFNITISHESSIHHSIPNEDLRHDPDKVPIPPYHPRTAEFKHDWAQYYDKVEDMDTRVGEILKELKDAGLDSNTIVFYYSDHGGILGRSKRFLYDSGLRIPLVIRFPEKYGHLAPGQGGTKNDQLVTFVDFAPTLLSLAGIDIPSYYQGKAFLGQRKEEANDYAFGFRGRMDERIDFSRTVRDHKFRYTRNYLPHKIYGQYLEYLWTAPSMRSWETAYKKGTLNNVQRGFWKTKPAEELYDTEKDPYNVNNLANDPAYKNDLERLRKANRDRILEIKDVGFIPEILLSEISKTTPVYTYARSGNYALEKILELAEMASEGNPANLPEFINKLDDLDPIVRYWAVTGLIVLKEKAKGASEKLAVLQDDPEVAVRIATAEALYNLGDYEPAISILSNALESKNMMVRVQALNVIDLMKQHTKSLSPKIQKILNNNPKDSDYDVRLAKMILQNYN